MPTDIAKYSIELFKPGGEHAGIEEINLIGTPTLGVARSNLLSLRRAVSWAIDHASGPRPRRVSIQQSPKIYGGKELSNYYKRLLLAGR